RLLEYFAKCYTGLLMVQRLSLEELQKVCPTRLGCALPISTYPPNMIAINTSGDRVACLVLMLPHEAIKAQGVDPPTRLENAHNTEFRELLYPWHPWSGL